jgi:hypothetical protein
MDDFIHGRQRMTAGTMDDFTHGRHGALWMISSMDATYQGSREGNRKGIHRALPRCREWLSQYLFRPKVCTLVHMQSIIGDETEKKRKLWRRNTRAHTNWRRTARSIVIGCPKIRSGKIGRAGCDSESIASSAARSGMAWYYAGIQLF